MPMARPARCRCGVPDRQIARGDQQRRRWARWRRRVSRRRLPAAATTHGDQLAATAALTGVAGSSTPGRGTGRDRRRSAAPHVSTQRAAGQRATVRLPPTSPRPRAPRMPARRTAMSVADDDAQSEARSRPSRLQGTQCTSTSDAGSSCLRSDVASVSPCRRAAAAGAEAMAPAWRLGRADHRRCAARRRQRRDDRRMCSARFRATEGGADAALAALASHAACGRFRLGHAAVFAGFTASHAVVHDGCAMMLHVDAVPTHA